MIVYFGYIYTFIVDFRFMSTNVRLVSYVSILRTATNQNPMIVIGKLEKIDVHLRTDTAQMIAVVTATAKCNK